jgi:hypothetical protein
MYAQCIDCITAGLLRQGITFGSAESQALQNGLPCMGTWPRQKPFPFSFCQRDFDNSSKTASEARTRGFEVLPYEESGTATNRSQKQNTGDSAPLLLKGCMISSALSPLPHSPYPFKNDDSAPFSFC